MIGDWTTNSEIIVELGTGEGQVLRHIEALRNRGFLVGIDPTSEQVKTGFERGSSINYLVAEGQHVPLASGKFDTAIACLVFEHIDEFQMVLGEVRRLLVRGGQFIFLLNHPLFQTPDSGWIDDQSFGDQYWRIGRYLERRVVVEEVEKNVFIPFVHRPLSDYLNAARKIGLGLVEMREPEPPQGFLDLAPEYYQSRFVPRLLGMLFEAL